MRALIVDPSTPSALRLAEVPEPVVALAPGPPPSASRLVGAGGRGSRGTARAAGERQGGPGCATRCRIADQVAGAQRLAISTAMSPDRNTPSNVPAPPMEATGAPSLRIRGKFSRSAPTSVPSTPET